MQRGKKALSPVITTILLVMIAIILAIIILMWARGFIKEGVQKFDNPIEDVRRDVVFNAQVAGSKEISVINSGSVPIYKFGVEISGEARISFTRMSLILFQAVRELLL